VPKPLLSGDAHAVGWQSRNLYTAMTATIALEALKDGKIRVNTSSWADPVVLLPGEVLEVRWVAGQLNLFRDSRPPEPPVSNPAKDFEEFA